jgi:hypothetical protein
MADLERHLPLAREPMILQPYHPGPFEAGIFYYRMPDEPRGRILSITDKHFPRVVGDGRSTLARTRPRASTLSDAAALFLERHREHIDRVLAADEPFQLAVAGNHAQGTMFRDGAHLITPELGAR